MKNILILVIFITFVTNCDRAYIAINYIENRTNSEIICYFYKADTINVSYVIGVNSTVQTYYSDIPGSNDYEILIDADSVIIQGYRDTLIFDYRFQEKPSFRSLYDDNNWVKKMEDESTYISTYIFE